MAYAWLLFHKHIPLPIAKQTVSVVANEFK